MAYAALEQSTTGQRPGWGTDALGQWVGREQLSPGAHTSMGWQAGRRGGPARGVEGPLVSPSRLEGLSH